MCKSISHLSNLKSTLLYFLWVLNRLQNLRFIQIQPHLHIFILPLINPQQVNYPQFWVIPQISWLIFQRIQQPLNLPFLFIDQYIFDIKLLLLLKNALLLLLNLKRNLIDLGLEMLHFLDLLFCPSASGLNWRILRHFSSIDIRPGL